MKLRSRGPLLVLFLLVLAIAPTHASTVVLASLPGGSKQVDSFFDGSPNGSGVCVKVPIGGTVTNAVWNVAHKPGAGGVQTGTMQVSVYSTTGTPGPSANCTTVAPVRLGSSQTINGQQILTGNQTFTFNFVNGPVLTNGQNIIVVLMTNFTDASQYNVWLNTAVDGSQNSVTFAGSWGDNGACSTIGSCEGYQLLNVSPDTIAPPTNPTNPVSYPCCTPVTAPALSGSALRVQDVDPAPLIYIFLILLLISLGAYTVRRILTRESEPNPRQYTLRVGKKK